MGAAGAPGPVGPPGPPGPDATSDFRVQAGIPQCYLPEQGLWVDLCVEPEVWRGGIIRSTFPNESGPAETPSNFPLGEQFFGVSFEHFWGYDPNEPPWRGLPACILNWMGTPEGPGTVTDYIQALFFEKPDGTFLEVRRDSSWTFVADGIHTNMVGLRLPDHFIPADAFIWSSNEEQWVLDWSRYTDVVQYSLSQLPGLGQPSPGPIPRQ
jgi:hypothetical protein